MGLVLVAPAVALVALLVIYPVGLVLKSAFVVGGHWTLTEFRVVFTQVPYPKLIFNTLSLAAEVTVVCLVLAIPLALLASKRGGRTMVLTAVGVALSFWTSIIVRTYGWFIVLGNAGPIARITGALGHPVQLLFTAPGTLLVMVNVMLPYMALPLLGVAVRQVDWSLYDAARSLGASPLRTGVSVLVPQLYSGIAAASTLTFVISTGFFVTPQLIGTPSQTMLSQQIYAELTEVYDTNRAAALSVVLIVIVAGSGLLYLIGRLLVRLISTARRSPEGVVDRSSSEDIVPTGSLGDVAS